MSGPSPDTPNRRGGQFLEFPELLPSQQTHAGHERRHQNDGTGLGNRVENSVADGAGQESGAVLRNVHHVVERENKAPVSGRVGVGERLGGVAKQHVHVAIRRAKKPPDGSRQGGSERRRTAVYARWQRKCRAEGEALRGIVGGAGPQETLTVGELESAQIRQREVSGLRGGAAEARTEELQIVVLVPVELNVPLVLPPTEMTSALAGMAKNRAKSKARQLKESNRGCPNLGDPPFLRNQMLRTARAFRMPAAPAIEGPQEAPRPPKEANR